MRNFEIGEIFDVNLLKETESEPDTLLIDWNEIVYSDNKYITLEVNLTFKSDSFTLRRQIYKDQSKDFCIAMNNIIFLMKIKKKNKKYSTTFESNLLFEFKISCESFIFSK